MDDLTEAQQDEYRAAVASVGESADAKGRKLVHTMTDREIAEESLLRLRAYGDALEELGQNPMLRALPGVGSLFGGR